MNWIEYDPENVKLSERKWVLVLFEANERKGIAPCAVAGYIRYWSDGPFFVTPGAKGVADRRITHYAECLPEDFKLLP